MRFGGLARALRWLGVASVLVVAAGAAGLYFWRGFELALAMRGDRVEVRIANGASARTIAHAIRAAGVDLNELEFVAAARASGATHSLRAGRYEIENGMSMRDVIAMIKRGEVLREELTVLEGTTFRELREQLEATAELRHETSRLTDAQLLEAVGAAEKDPEGLFAPDTYVFDPGSSDMDLYRRAYQTQAERLARAWYARASGLPYQNAYEALIMASLIEKETGRADERRRVAAVFVNRQHLKMPLQTDPSVIYGLGDRFDGRLHRKDLEADTPYNTYLRTGLPPTPIALPGLASIDAALNPESTHDLYFVARGDGTSQFSTNFTEHQRAVDRFVRASSAASAAATAAKAASASAPAAATAAKAASASAPAAATAAKAAGTSAKPAPAAGASAKAAPGAQTSAKAAPAAEASTKAAKAAVTSTSPPKAAEASAKAAKAAEASAKAAGH
jgi:UPF0755 protein